MASGKTYPTVDEAVSYLNKSSLPTVITEGKDDYLVFRRLEDQLSDLGVDVMPVGSRATVLGIFERRAEIAGRSDIVYVADKDIWVFSEIPNVYASSDVVFSDGYSIENDLFRDGPIVELMTEAEHRLFKSELEKFTEWYALAVSRALSGEGETLCVTPAEFFNDAVHQRNLLSLREGEIFPLNLHSRCLDEYDKLLRGKSLLGLALRQLSATTRIAKHSRSSLIEQAAVRQGPLLADMTARIHAALRPPA